MCCIRFRIHALTRTCTLPLLYHSLCENSPTYQYRKQGLGSDPHGYPIELPNALTPLVCTTNIHMHVYARQKEFVCASMYKCLCVCMHACMYTVLCIYLYIDVCILYVCACACALPAPRWPCSCAVGPSAPWPHWGTWHTGPWPWAGSRSAPTAGRPGSAPAWTPPHCSPSSGTPGNMEGQVGH